ncbi:MAG: carboxypeptidase-like regulatory domain-containing protein [Terriglobales bacterium]
MLSSFTAAQNITGTVTNATTGKPSAGDEVTLLSLSQGMQEVANTKSDAQGRFSLPAPAGDPAPHMVRVTHEGVNYFPQGGPLMPGTTTAQLTVYDSAKKVDGVSQTVEVDRYQSDGKQLQGIALFAIRNQSQPPRTVADDKRTFEFVLPDGAELESAQAKGPGGQPIAVEAAPGAQKNRYAFNYPLRPGETQFQVSYHMPYSGEASISPKPLGEVQHFVVMTPKGMTFTPKNPQQFQSMPDETGAGIMVVTNVKPGQDLSFRVGGAGEFQAEGQQGAQSTGRGDASGGGAMGGSQGATNDNRPGGGLGAPIDAPDPLHDYRAYILGAFALVLVMGGAYVVSKSNVRPHPAAAAAGGSGRAAVDDREAAADFANFTEPSALARDRNALLLEAMKEELFQLEIDRQQGKISPEEYAKAKAALDETIRRALARNTKS